MNALNNLLPAALVGCVAFILCGAPSRAQSQPNIVFIMVDDAGLGDMTSYWEDSPVQTPTIDALAAEGLKFTSAYAGPNCALSRSMLMTGQHLGHAHVRTNGGSMSIRDRDVTIAEVLQTAGYRTGGFGKWGLGTPGSAGAPERQGFDEFFGYYNQTHAHSHYAERLYRNSQPVIVDANVGISEPETGLMSNGQHDHVLIVDEMKSFVRRSVADDQPFFAWGAWTPPHRRSTLPVSESQPGGAYAPYANNAGWDDFDKIQAGFVTWIDRQVGEMLNVLDDPNGDGDASDSVADNTLFVFASDNGGWQSNHNWDRTQETIHGQTVDLRGAKNALYEGGTRVPLIARWPGQIQAGSETDFATYFPDLMPTLAELAGATEAVPSQIDGISIAPTLLGEGNQTPRNGLYWEIYSNGENSPPRQAGRLGDWKLMRNPNGSLELYHLASDPDESNNVAGNATNAAVLNQLLSFLDQSSTPQRPQININPGDVSSGPGAQDGTLPFAMRPLSQPNDWRLDQSGDADSLQGPLIDRFGDAVGLYLDDLHYDYELELTIERAGSPSPLLVAELVGDSGFVYYEATYDLAEQPAGSTTEAVLDFAITSTTPSDSHVTNDVANGLNLRFSHSGGSGEALIHASRVFVPNEPLFADLDQNGELNELDWLIFRDHLFEDLTLLPNDEAYLLGDLNLDGLNNEFDFALFKDAYKYTNGQGAFAMMLQSVPEPSAHVMILVAIAWCLHSVTLCRGETWACSVDEGTS